MRGYSMVAMLAAWRAAQVSMAMKRPPDYPGPPFLRGPMPPPRGLWAAAATTTLRPFRPRPMPRRPAPPFVTSLAGAHHWA
ncbi:transport and Golgi organization protein 1 homolog isoform X2 [Cavia porcellus]|uniref:transport and Golgi organization protein 1 homolog isoform X2 n=1 Tax=Cavia porcellus TaxID=10141 RepID=UPI002FE3EF66